MKHTMKSMIPLAFIALFGLILAGCNSSSSSSGVIPGSNTMADGSTADATYRVTFTATWSSATHTSFPSGAHFSPLVGAIHKSTVAFWATGDTASAGIESMAETGATGTLAQEIQNAITAGTAGATLSGTGTNSPGSVTFTFEISEAYPLVTLVSMIAPSPDWFTGVRGVNVNLFDGGTWAATKTINLFAYDAGTDNGADFGSANDDTQPRNNIALLTSNDFDANQVGTFTFTRL